MHGTEACVKGKVSGCLPLLAGTLGIREGYIPEQCSTRHCRLYYDHLSACDMVQYPVSQLAVEGERVHAELCEGPGVREYGSAGVRWKEGSGHGRRKRMG